MSTNIFLAKNSIEGRWATLGPYYAMFPTDFAFSIVEKHSPERGRVLDPFAGRATNIFAAESTGRIGVGIEINPVGWIYGQAKLYPADLNAVLSRLREIANEAERTTSSAIDDLNPFFHWCYSPKVLKFLIAARRSLAWRTDSIDTTLMAVILVYLHGKLTYSLSNQLRQNKSMSPDYCVRWWASRNMTPPDIDPVTFLEKRIRWRYAAGRLENAESSMILGDCMLELDRIARLRPSERFDLLFTSPPYFGVANYFYDQWLRLWMLGYEQYPVRSRGEWQGKFTSREAYERLLFGTFKKSASLMKPDATIYVRTDAREYSRNITLEALEAAFPRKHVVETTRPFLRDTQTALFGDKTQKPGETDIVLR